MTRPRNEPVPPSAASLLPALRNVGHKFHTAVADLVDNSIDADASRVEIAASFNSGDPWLRIADDGTGMTSNTLTEALRLGSRSDRGPHSLGTFGLGLKTASLSQCRRILIATKDRPSAPIMVKALDLDHIEETDRWEIQDLGDTPEVARVTEPLQDRDSGTVVMWQNLDRLHSYPDRDTPRARDILYRRLEQLDRHLGMVLHRFLTGAVPGRPRLRIALQGTGIEAWDPFVQAEEKTEELEQVQLDVVHRNYRGTVFLSPFVLPNRTEFSSPDAFDSAGHGKSWNTSQGLWIYRANRLIQDGGWSRLRAADEHTKYARAALEFQPDLDNAFNIDIAKMTVGLPRQLRDDLKPHITRLTKRANERYRYKPSPKRRPRPDPTPNIPTPAQAPTVPYPEANIVSRPTPPLSPSPPSRPLVHNTSPLDETPTPVAMTGDHIEIGATLDRAAIEIGESESLERIKIRVRQINAGASDALGW